VTVPPLMSRALDGHEAVKGPVEFERRTIPEKPSIDVIVIDEFPIEFALTKTTAGLGVR
jgi:hypothetical protein